MFSRNEGQGRDRSTSIAGEARGLAVNQVRLFALVAMVTKQGGIQSSYLKSKLCGNS